MRELINELYQIVFMGSIFYLINTLFSFSMKAYGYFFLKKEDIVYSLKNSEKIILWVSVSIFMSYLIK